MKLFLAASDLIGFVAISTSAALASSLLSLLQLTVRYLLQLLEKIVRFFRTWKPKMPVTFIRAEKNGTKWYRLSVGRYSLMIGKAK